MRLVNTRVQSGFLLPAVLILLFTLMVLSYALVTTGSNATKYVIEADILNKEEQCIFDSQVHWKEELESGKYNQENPNPTSDYIVTPLLGGTNFKMQAKFNQNESLNRPLPDNPAFDPEKIPSVAYKEEADSPYFGYNRTHIPPWHFFLSLESQKNKRYSAMFSAAFPYGVYAPKGSVSLNTAGSYSNPTAIMAEEAGWEDIGATGVPLNILAQDDIIADDYYHGYAYSLQGDVKITNKNGAIGLRQKEAYPNYSEKYEEDILAAYDKLADIAMDKTNYLKGAPLDYGLFCGMIYSTVETIIDPEDSAWASLFSLEQAAQFPFLVIPTISEKFGGLIWNVYFHYPDLPDRYLPSPEDEDFAETIAKYEKMKELLEWTAAIEYCWLNPDIDPEKETDWQKRYLHLDQICPKDAYFRDEEFFIRQNDVDKNVLQPMIKGKIDAKYSSRLDVFKYRHFTHDDAKDISDNYLNKKLVQVYSADAKLKYEVQYKNNKDSDWVKTDYYYNIKVETDYKSSDSPSSDKVRKDLEKKAKDKGKSKEVKKQVTDDYQRTHGAKYDIKTGDPKDVTLSNVIRMGGDDALYFKQKTLYDKKAYDKHKSDIWPGKVDTHASWQHMHNNATFGDKWYDDHSLFDREMYLKYGFLLEIEDYYKDEDFPDDPGVSRYDEMSLRTEIDKVPKTVYGEPDDLHGIVGANYGKLVWHFFRGVYQSFKSLGKAIVDGDPMEFFAGLEGIFEETRRVIHFRGRLPDMQVFDKGDSVSILSDWTVPRGRTLKIKGNLIVIGDIWIQDGATLHVEGYLLVADKDKLKQLQGKSSSHDYLKKQLEGGFESLVTELNKTSSSSYETDKSGERMLAEGQVRQMSKGKEQFFKPSGRVFIGKGANLLVGGDFTCMGSPEMGSVIIDSEIGDVTYISSSILCKGNVTIPYGILPGISPASLGTYLADKGLPEWKKFLREFELVPSQVAKVAGPFEKRLCCFARYPNPITILNLDIIIIPFPTFYSLKTNMNISIYRSLSLAYMLILNGALGENLFTDSRWWALLREDKLYSETKTPKKEDVEEFLYSKEAEEKLGGVPVFPKIGGTMALEKCAETFKTIPTIDMSEYSMNARYCLEMTMFDKILEKLMHKLIEEILVEIFADVFGEGEFMKEVGEKLFEFIAKELTQIMFSGTLEEYLKHFVECNPAPAIMKIGVCSNIYMKSKTAELNKILSESNPQYLIYETSGVLIYSGKKLKIGNSEQKPGDCVFAPGLFIANGDIEIFADRTIGCLISVKGNVSAKNFYYYPYFTRASLNVPAKISYPIWQYMKEYFVSDEDNYKSNELPIEIGEIIYNVTAEGWNK